MTLRICLFGQGPLCDAIEVALEAQGHLLSGPFSSPQPTNVLRGTQASVGLSAGYRHKLTPQEWQCFPDGILNLHTGYLPWNKGAYPNVWPILDGSPAGVTLHRVDEGIDTGPILAQVEVPVSPIDTAKTLYDKLLEAAVTLCDQEFFYASSHGWSEGEPQDPQAGSKHRSAEWMDGPLDEVMSLETYHPATQWFLAGLRASTFPGYGLRYRQDGKLIEATITLKEVTE